MARPEAVCWVWREQKRLAGMGAVKMSGADQRECREEWVGAMVLGVWRVPVVTQLLAVEIALGGFQLWEKMCGADSDGTAVPTHFVPLRPAGQVNPTLRCSWNSRLEMQIGFRCARSHHSITISLSLHNIGVS